MSIHLQQTRPTLGGVAPSPAPMASVHPLQPMAATAPPRRFAVGKALAGVFKTGLRASAVAVVVLFGTLFVVERFAAPEWKPSALIGTFGGNQEYAHTLASLDAHRAKVAVEQQEAARAQQEINALVAANQRVTEAYSALYQRGNLMAQAWANAAQQQLGLAMQARLEGLRGQVSNAGAKDRFAMLCEGLAIFMREASPYCTQLRDSAREDRASVEADIDAAFTRQSAFIATKLRTWSNGLPDPAELMAQRAAAQEQALQAAPRAPVPPMPVPRQAAQPTAG